MPGDLVFIIGGILPFLYIAYVAVRHFSSPNRLKQFTENPLFEVLPSDGKVATTKVGAGHGRRDHIGAATADTGSGRRLVMSAPSISTWMVATYALVLVGVAWAFTPDGKAHLCRAAQWQTGDFVYHEDHDAW